MQRRKPWIGITTYGPDGERPTHSLPEGYSHAVARAGGVPLLLPACGVEASETLERVDGLILSGGGDLDPALYGGEPHPTVYQVIRARDAFELALARESLSHPDLPVLGICRGMQVMNVALGGDLFVHLPDAVGEGVTHRLPPREPTSHPVEVEGASLLEEIYGIRSFPVCSWHHQAVRRMGAGLRPIAYSEDGVVEALLYSEHDFALGVQWHPEMQVREDPLQRRLFAALVERARKRRCA